MSDGRRCPGSGAEVGTLAQRLAEEEAQRGKAEEAKEDAVRRSEAAGREVAALTQRLSEEGAARLKAEGAAFLGTEGLSPQCGG